MRQRDHSDCGPTCLAYLCRRLGRPRPIALLRQWAGTDRGGTTALGLVQAGERAGLTVQGVRGQPADFAGLPLPLIAHVILPSRLHHYLVLERVGRTRVRVMDPAVGRSAGWDRTRLEGLCSGVFLLVAPAPAGGAATAT
ncbi:MAG TPA: cysteine peptidase family C39 domain-containing protein, partial [Opitutaceae bacterium]|nr:cysteine peptidase family C39 domain-containing protein [Opitutaceae bacterium]